MAAKPDGPSATAVLEVADGLRWCDPHLSVALGEHALRTADDTAVRRAARLAVIRAIGLLERPSDVVTRLLPYLRDADRDGWTDGVAAARAELAVASVGCDDAEAAEALVSTVDVGSLPSAIGERVALARTWSRAANGDVAGADAAARLVASPQPMVRLDLLRARAAARRQSGDLDGALALLGRARRGSSSDADGGRRAASLTVDQVDILLDLDRADDARALADDLLAGPTDGVTVLPLSRLRCVLALRVHLPAGELDEAERLAQGAENDLASRGHDDGLASAVATLAAVAEARGRPDEALAAHRRAAELEAHARDGTADARRVLVRAACGVFGALPGTAGAERPGSSRGRELARAAAGDGSGGAGDPAGTGASNGSADPDDDTATPTWPDGTRRTRHRAHGEAATASVLGADGVPVGLSRPSRHRRADDAHIEDEVLDGTGAQDETWLADLSRSVDLPWSVDLSADGDRTASGDRPDLDLRAPEGRGSGSDEGFGLEAGFGLERFGLEGFGLGDGFDLGGGFGPEPGDGLGARGVSRSGDGADADGRPGSGETELSREGSPPSAGAAPSNGDGPLDALNGGPLNGGPLNGGAPSDGGGPLNGGASVGGGALPNGGAPVGGGYPDTGGDPYRGRAGSAPDHGIGGWALEGTVPVDAVWSAAGGSAPRPDQGRGGRVPAGPGSSIERPTDALAPVSPGAPRERPDVTPGHTAYEAELALTRAGLLAEYAATGAGPVGPQPGGPGDPYSGGPGDPYSGDPDDHPRGARLGSLLADAMEAFRHGDGVGRPDPHPRTGAASPVAPGSGSVPTPLDRRPVGR